MKSLLLLLLLFCVTVPVSAQVSTPQPPPLPTQEMYEALATQNANLNDLPESLQNPDGRPLLPDEDGTQLFGYIKWLIDPTMADEWAGPFAPVFQHIGIGVYMVFAMAGVYFVTYAYNNIGGWVMWLVEQGRKALDLVMQILQAGPAVIIVALVLFALFAVAIILVGDQNVQQWVSDQFDSILQFVYDLTSRMTGGI